MSVRKSYRINFSTKFPDGSIVSATFGTEMEEDDVVPSELFKKVYDSTVDDLKECLKIDKFDKAAFDAVKRQIRKIDKIKQKEKERLK